MDGEKRKLFWEKLLSLCGSDPELKDLNDFIEYPNRIFRYRKMSVETLSGEHPKNCVNLRKGAK